MRRLLLVIPILCSLAFAQEIRRPTTEANATTSACGTSTHVTSTSIANAYDGGSGDATAGEATSSTFNQVGGTDADVIGGKLVSGWVAASGSYTALSLKIRSGCVVGGVGGSCGLEYSTNSGTTWTTIHDGAGWAVTTDSITLSNSQNLTTVYVRACGNGLQDAVTLGTVAVTIWDVRTEGILAVAPKRRAVVVNAR